MSMPSNVRFGTLGSQPPQLDHEVACICSQPRLHGVLFGKPIPPREAERAAPEQLDCGDRSHIGAWLRESRPDCRCVFGADSEFAREIGQRCLRAPRVPLGA